LRRGSKLWCPRIGAQNRPECPKRTLRLTEDLERRGPSSFGSGRSSDAPNGEVEGRGQAPD
jgi:hypothetical protein